MDNYHKVELEGIEVILADPVEEEAFEELVIVHTDEYCTWTEAAI